MPNMVSPPTRGWPAGKIAVLRHISGFPAHAGMAPSCTVKVRLVFGFPRPRGDGP